MHQANKLNLNFILVHKFSVILSIELLSNF